MKTWIDFDRAPVFAIPLADGSAMCEGMLIEGPQGWGEFSPPAGLDDRRAARWLTAAIEVGTVGWPDPLRGRVPIAVTIPAVDADAARTTVAESGCRTAAVAVGAGAPADDIARLAAVRDAVGPDGAIRVNAHGRWDVATAASAVPELDRAAGGLEFIEDPCRTLEEIASVRRAVDLPVAVGAAIRDAAAPMELALRDAADIAVLSASPLGGVRRALRVAEICGLPCLVTGSVQSSVGAAGGLALAGVLPDTGFAHELGGVRSLAGDLVSAARSLVSPDGYLPVAPMPSAPQPDHLDRFAAATDRIAWWRRRLTGVERYI